MKKTVKISEDAHADAADVASILTLTGTKRISLGEAVATALEFWLEQKRSSYVKDPED
jgi:hypothetical protein